MKFAQTEATSLTNFMQKKRNDVLKEVEGTTPDDFVLLDTRGTEAFGNDHIPGAWSVAESDLQEAISLLPRVREIVTYCCRHD
ncbi:MAG TPA: rhodanese-like domain-containing protein [Candidatus Acidoferrum sp.]|nr:rhodanese-like domain-containing protein [Candidatus Acidoferrum sp.]